MKTSELKIHELLTTNTSVRLRNIIEREDFSSLDHLLSMTGLVLKYCHVLQNRIHHDRELDTIDENTRGEELCILESQRLLVTDKSFQQWKCQFDLFQNEKDIWRCRGRFKILMYLTKLNILFYFQEITIYQLG